MKKATYLYSAFPLTPSQVHPTGATAFRPLARAFVAALDGESEPCLVLLDSGADVCLFPLSLALDLNLNLQTLPSTMTRGVGSQANVTYYATVTIDLGNGIRFSAYAGFTQGLDAVGVGLLGQSGFFDQFHVEFRHKEKIFTIEPA